MHKALLKKTLLIIPLLKAITKYLRHELELRKEQLRNMLSLIASFIIFVGGATLFRLFS